MQLGQGLRNAILWGWSDKCGNYGQAQFPKQCEASFISRLVMKRPSSKGGLGFNEIVFSG